jgi:hypothetical protein
VRTGKSTVCFYRRRYIPPKRRLTPHIHGAKSQKTAFFIVTAVKASNLTPSVYVPPLMPETKFHTHYTKMYLHFDICVDYTKNTRPRNYTGVTVHKVTAVSMFMYGSENRALNGSDRRNTETAEMCFSTCRSGYAHLRDRLQCTDRLCSLVFTVPGYRSTGPGFDSRRYPIF